MIRIDLETNRLDLALAEFLKQWLPKAEAATLRAIERWESWYVDSERSDKPPNWPDADQQIWRELRDKLLAHVTHHKCAYCETRVARNPADTEHYRPKGAVSFRRLESTQAEIVRVSTPDGNRVKHPGYFWLAFNFHNLLPSCRRCNAIHGKQTQFPLRASRYVFLHKPAEDTPLADGSIESPTWRGWFYLSPSDLDILEEPMLLHPYNDNPRRDLVFLDCGTVLPRQGGDAEKANHSINVFDLNDEALRLERQERQLLARHVYLGKVCSLLEDGRNLEESYGEAFRVVKLLSPSSAYSAAARDAVYKCIPEECRGVWF